MERVGLPVGLFPALRQPGDVIGPVNDTPAGAGAGLVHADGKPLPLIAVGSHDTASAVVAVPAEGENFAYISSGTWSLVGMELDRPVLSEASRVANFTNEAGIDGTVRYLRNVSGLWLLQECLRHWGATAGQLEVLLADAAGVPPLRFVFNADDPVFLPPGDMPARIQAWLAERDLPAPASPPEVVRCVLDSLALAYRRALADAQELSGRHADVVHVVGGGARNELLCQLTADATGLPVVAGPAEATALGNVLVQARALGAAPDSLNGLRALLRASPAVAGLRHYAPSGDTRAWAAVTPA
jgi:rhamnulokinase